MKNLSLCFMVIQAVKGNFFTVESLKIALQTSDIEKYRTRVREATFLLRPKTFFNQMIKIKMFQINVEIFKSIDKAKIGIWTFILVSFLQRNYRSIFIQKFIENQNNLLLTIPCQLVMSHVSMKKILFGDDKIYRIFSSIMKWNKYTCSQFLYKKNLYDSWKLLRKSSITQIQLSTFRVFDFRPANNFSIILQNLVESLYLDRKESLAKCQDQFNAQNRFNRSEWDR